MHLSTFCKKTQARLRILPLHQNHIRTDLPPYFFGEVSQNYLKCCLLAIVLILPQIKLNSHLSWCAFFFFSWHIFFNYFQNFVPHYHQQKQVEEGLWRTKQKGLGLIHYCSQREFWLHTHGLTPAIFQLTSHKTHWKCTSKHTASRGTRLKLHGVYISWKFSFMWSTTGEMSQNRIWKDRKRERPEVTVLCSFRHPCLPIIFLFLFARTLSGQEEGRGRWGQRF